MGGVSGSLNLRLYRMARRDGASTEEAAAFADVGLGEARLIDADDAKHPPEPACYEVPAGMLRAWSVQGDPARITALCGPWGRAS